MSKSVVAAFDFDGTLSSGTSGRRFFRQLLGPVGLPWFLFRRAPTFLAYQLRIEDERMLERITAEVFSGRDHAEVQKEAEYFAQHTLPNHLMASSMERLHWHLGQAHRCVVVSRGYEIYLRPWTRSLGIEDLLATRLQIDPHGFFTGRLLEPSCDRSQKLTRLRELIGDLSAVELFAYGDSAGDHAMLAAADHPFIRTRRGFVPWINSGSS